MQPFSGVKVLDLTHVLAGPFCTYQLSVMGADVIKIEPPKEPDMVRPAGGVADFNKAGMGLSYLTQNANKRAITLDIKTPKGQAILKRLAATADVLVENYRAGALAKLGLGYDDLSKLNPRLIYCSMTGFGQTGPKGGQTAYDNVIQAASGLMTLSGEPGTKPYKVGPPVLDYGSGAMAAYAVACALFQRTRTGKGQRIDASMLDSAIMLMASTVIDYMNGGGMPKLSGNDSPNAGYSCYETKDGLLMIGAYTTGQHARLWKALGKPEMGGNLKGLTDIDAAHDSHAEALKDILKTKTADEWAKQLRAAGLPAERVLKLDEAMAQEQLKHRGVFHTIPKMPGLEKDITVPVASFTYAHGGPSIRSAPPKFGEHTDEVLGGLGYGAEDIKALRKEGIV
ncbi:MAG: CaiB/BaiF CoA transferase family protein [Alphaproteobacteria bacterium]